MFHWTKVSSIPWYRFLSALCQFAHHPGQRHFRVSRLEAALHRRPEPALRLGVVRGLAEEIGIAPEILGEPGHPCVMMSGKALSFASAFRQS
jgi:hypothetical protein